MTQPATWSRELDIAAVERELQRLLRLPENTSANGVPGVRTAALNLVAFASDPPTRERIIATLAALMDHHPSRTIVVIGQNAPDGPEIDARVQVDCKPMGTTGLHVCSEHVIVESHPRALRRVPNVVVPLLLSDLPVVFWWPGEPALRDPLLYDLLTPANRFVVDTASFVHVERTLITLAGLRRRLPALDLSDLNWCRLIPWRELIAQLWDVPTWRTPLSRLDRIEIELGKPPGGRSNRAQALLLAGWLGSRLGWTPLGMERRPDGYVLRAKRRGGTIVIAVRIRREDSSGLRSVRFVRESARSGADLSIVAGDGDAATMSVRLRSEEVYTRNVRIEHLTEPELLAGELDMATGEMVFEESLTCASRFLTESATRATASR